MLETQKSRLSILLEMIDEMSNKEFWEWASDWVERDFIRDVVKQWDEEEIREEIRAIKRMIKRKREARTT